MTNNKRENIYCDYSGRIFTFLNDPQQESLISGICNYSNYSLLNLQNSATKALVTPKNIPQVIIQ